MTDKLKNKILTVLGAVILLGLAVWCFVKPADSISESERRPLATMPAITADNIVSGKFMTDFEKYSTDQFPLREQFRAIKAFMNYYVFRQKDMGGVYLSDGYVSKIEYPTNMNSVDYAAAKFEKVYNKYLKDSNTTVYLSVIPDKNYFMAEQNGYPSMDYEKFIDALKEKTGYMKYIDIFDLLELEDYYKTDTHWRQENIVDVAERLASSMGAEINTDLKKNELDVPFHGVYYGQSALPLPAEKIFYLTDEAIEGCKVYNFESQKDSSVYDMEKANGKDPYEMYLSGPISILKVTNENAKSGKKLVLFRDSFGSSIAPLLISGYSEITLVDIRYISSELIGKYVDFTDSDVLFLYSTMVLNNSNTIK